MELLKTMTYFRCLPPTETPMATDIRSEFSDCQWYQWQSMAANGTNGNITNSTTGKTPNARNISRFGDSMDFQNLQKSHSTNRIIWQIYNMSTVLTMIVHKSNIDKAT